MHRKKQALEQPLPDCTEVRVTMLRKKITSRHLQRRLRVSQQSVSMGLTGQRKRMLRRIADYVDRYPSKILRRAMR